MRILSGHITHEKVVQLWLDKHNIDKKKGILLDRKRNIVYNIAGNYLAKTNKYGYIPAMIETLDKESLLELYYELLQAD